MKFTLCSLFVVAVLVAVVSWGYVLVHARLLGGVGYAVRGLCQVVFVQNRTFSTQKPYCDELEGIYSDLTDLKVDLERKLVTGKIDLPFLGHIQQTAIHTAMGCNLNPEYVALPFIPMRNKVEYLPISPVSKPKLNQVLNREMNNASYMTRSVIIVQNGKIIAQRYADGWDHDMLQIGWSMSKSVLSTLIGIRVSQGKMNLNDTIDAPEWKKTPNDPRREITLNDMLHMSSGLKFVETPTDFQSNLVTMLYTTKSHAEYAASFPLDHNPGTFWMYSSATTNILSRSLRKTFESDEEYWNFARKALFGPLGMNHNSMIEVDGVGDLIGSSYAFLTAEDWAKYGLLYLNGGIWKENRIISKDWVKYTSTSAPASDLVYGAHWWLPGKRFPRIPKDCYMALGHEHQIVMVCPSMNLVLVRLGTTKGHLKWNENDFLGDIVDALKTQQ